MKAGQKNNVVRMNLTNNTDCKTRVMVSYPHDKMWIIIDCGGGGV